MRSLRARKTKTKTKPKKTKSGEERERDEIGTRRDEQEKPQTNKPQTSHKPKPQTKT